MLTRRRRPQGGSDGNLRVEEVVTSSRWHQPQVGSSDPHVGGNADLIVAAIAISGRWW